MTSNLSFLNSHLIWVVVPIALVVLTVFIWKEWSAPLKNRFFISAFFALLLVISLSLLVLQPAVWSNGEATSGVLLTKGHTKEQLDSLKKENRFLKTVPYKEGESLKKSLDSLTALTIIGEGVQSYDLWQLNEIPVRYLASKVPRGIVRLKYNQQEYKGNDLLINGLYNKPHLGNMLLLSGPDGQSIDSVLLSGEGEQVFRLKTNLKLSGNYEFSITEKDSLGNILSLDPLPVCVLNKPSLRILVINEFPSFETKYLKNFLAEKNHEVVVRSRITRGRYKFEYFNTARKPIYSLTEAALESFDLLIIDYGSYRNFSSKSRAVLETAVRDNGLGLFIQPGRGFFTRSLGIAKFSFKPHGSEEVRGIGEPKFTISKAPFLFIESEELIVVHKSSRGVMTAYERLGQGRVGSTVLNNTYQLLLQGNKTEYQLIWSGLLSEIGKRAAFEVQWGAVANVTYKDEPFNFKLRTAIEKPQVLTMNSYSYRVPLKSDPEIKEIWYGTTYPRRSGWDSLYIASDTTLVYKYYINEDNHWQALRTYKTIAENKRQFSNPKISEESRPILKRISPLWFFLLFLFSAGFLWWYPKYRIN